MGWRGIVVKHRSGLTGVVSESWSGFLHVGLKIQADDGQEHFVQLNSNGPDTGEQGWLWLMDPAKPHEPDSWGVLSDRPLQPVPDSANADFVFGWMRAERDLQLQRLFEGAEAQQMVSGDQIEGYSARMALEDEALAPVPEMPTA